MIIRQMTVSIWSWGMRDSKLPASQSRVMTAAINPPSAIPY